MPVLSKDEYFARLHERLGDDVSEESISFLEDMTDTYEDMERRATGDGVDWEARYRALDESWKARYRHRFFTAGNGGAGDPNAGSDEPAGYDPSSITIDNLFVKK